MVCFSSSPNLTLRSPEAHPGREPVCAAHAVGMFAASRCTTNWCARRNRLFATEWMFCFRVEPQQLRRRLCHSWWWGLGYTIRCGWYFVRYLSLFIFSTHDNNGHHSIWFWSVRTPIHSFLETRGVCRRANTVPQRANLPRSIREATSTSSIDLSDWGPPSASYPAPACDISRFFTAQQLVFDITLCGIWFAVF